MKLSFKIIFYTAFITALTQCSEIIIRPATENDLNALNELSHNVYQNDFKALWKSNYILFTPLHQTIDVFVAEKEQINNKNNAYFIKQQKIDDNYCLLLAKIKNENKTEQVAGFCRFQKTDANKNMYIRYIIVDEQFRKQGIAKKLIKTALQKWYTVTTCKFYTLQHHQLINDIAKKYNCTITNRLAYDFNTNKINYFPHTPKTHYTYTYTIKKNDRNILV